MSYRGSIVDGIEPDREDFEKASKILRAVFHGNVEVAFSKDFKNNKYDYITFMDVIEHLYDTVEVLSTAKKHLKPNGRILFSIPNMAHISVRLMLLKGDFEYGKTGLLDNTHLHFYTKKEIERIFNEAGFFIDELRASEATYPKELIEKKLKEVGIKSSDKILKILSDESAQIFQYVGTARASTKNDKKQDRVEYSPDPQGEISREYEVEFNRLYQLLKDERARSKELEGQIQSIKEQPKLNPSIKRQILYKMLGRIKTIR
jgi:SAM-dependent methyltransferase